MSLERGPTTSQGREGGLRHDGLEQCGVELNQCPPSAGPGQAADAQWGESSSASTNGSSRRMLRR